MLFEKKKPLYKLILFETYFWIFRIVENFSSQLATHNFKRRFKYIVSCDMEIATGNGKDLSERLNCYCYRIIRCGNLLVLHLSHLVNIPNDQNFIRFPKYYDIIPAIAKISVTFS